MRQRSSATKSRPSGIRKILGWAAIAIALALAIGSAAFVWWALTPLGPGPIAIASLQPDDDIRVEQTPDLLVMSPADNDARTGVILYPGGRVDHLSYAPLARELAERGYLVAVCRMPLNLAVFAPDRARDVMERYPEILVWGIGGHSLGGAMAASFVASNPDDAEALILLAAYPAGDTDISETGLPVVSLVGTRDGVLSQERFDDGVGLLPEDTRYVPIEGGNHAQFGDYGPQPGDQVASIPADEQLWITAEEIALLMRPLRMRTLGK